MDAALALAQVFRSTPVFRNLLSAFVSAEPLTPFSNDSKHCAGFLQETKVLFGEPILVLLRCKVKRTQATIKFI